MDFDSADPWNQPWEHYYYDFDKDVYSTKDHEGNTHSELEPIEVGMFLSVLELEAVDWGEPKMAYIASRAGRWTYSGR